MLSCLPLFIFLHTVCMSEMQYFQMLCKRIWCSTNKWNYFVKHFNLKNQHCTPRNDKIKIRQIQIAQQLMNTITVWSLVWPRIAKLSVSQQRLSISKITLALCCPSLPGLFSTAGQGTIGRFVDTELNRWHPQCRQTGRQAKRLYICLHPHWRAHTPLQQDRHSFFKMAALRVRFVPQ